MENISEIISLQIPQNIIEIYGKCNYRNAPIIWHHWDVCFCKNCDSLVCKFCTNYNGTKCGICLTNEYGFCKLCKEKIKILPCSKCINIIKQCYFKCDKNNTINFYHKEGFYCKYC